ncbi:unnamed protein product, partial [Brassicogethes aeneus]
ALYVYFAAFYTNLISINVGAAFAWTSPVLPKFKQLGEDNPFGQATTTSEDAWITSLSCLGAAFGPIISGYLSEKLGRKKTLLLFSLPMIVCQIITMFGDKVYVFLVARFLWGLGMGCVMSVVPAFIGEISEDKNRGLLGVFMSLFIKIGIILMYAVGPFVNMTILGLVNLIPLLLFLSTFGLLVPETPYHFLKNDVKVKAKKSLVRFRGKNCDVKLELEEMTMVIEESKASKASIKDMFSSKPLKKGLMISCGLFFFQQFAGINAVLGNMETIFQAAKSSFPAKYAATFLGVIQMIMTFLVSQLADRLGRKILLLISSLGSCLSIAGLSVYFALSSNKYDVSSVSWLPTLSLLIYIICFNTGLSCLPFAILGEIFPVNFKSLASSMATSVNMFLAFLVTMFYPHVSEALGLAGSFGLFALFCLIGFLFTLFVVPETKGKSLMEIQRILNDEDVDSSIE